MGNNSSSHQAVVGQLIGQSLGNYQAVIRKSLGSDISSSISTSSREWRVGLVFPISYLDGGYYRDGVLNKPNEELKKNSQIYSKTSTITFIGFARGKMNFNSLTHRFCSTILTSIHFLTYGAKISIKEDWSLNKSIHLKQTI